jgi:hypothetical protein
MKETGNPQINMSKIPMGGGILGGLAAIACVLIVLLGIPALWYAVPFALGLGCVIAVVLRLGRHKTPGAPWILPSLEEHSRSEKREPDSDEPSRMRLVLQS